MKKSDDLDTAPSRRSSRITPNTGMPMPMNNAQYVLMKAASFPSGFFTAFAFFVVGFSCARIIHICQIESTTVIEVAMVAAMLIQSLVLIVITKIKQV